MHSDKELLKIFSEDSKLHDEKMVGIKVEDKEDKDIKVQSIYIYMYVCTFIYVLLYT
jgi:hypothetical protein